MNYDRRTASGPRLEQLLHKPAEADEALTKAYLALTAFKSGFDSMDEIPESLLKLYEQIMNALSEVADAKKHTYQVRMMAQRLPR